MNIVNEGKGHLEEYMDGVRFQVVRSTGNYCCCNGCFKCTRVNKLFYPETCYHDKRRLSTKTLQMWLCDECTQKLIDALTHPIEVRVEAQDERD